jgi:hypothetical protein
MLWKILDMLFCEVGVIAAFAFVYEANQTIGTIFLDPFTEAEFYS